MDRWTGYSLIGHTAIAVILLGVTVVSLQRQADQMDRWFDRTQKQMERLEKVAPWVDDVEHSVAEYCLCHMKSTCKGGESVEASICFSPLTCSSRAVLR